MLKHDIRNELVPGLAKAEERVTELEAEGAIAWFEPEYGGDMGHENVYWGHRVFHLTLPQLLTHCGRAVVRHEPNASNVVLVEVEVEDATEPGEAMSRVDEDLVYYQNHDFGERDSTINRMRVVGVRAGVTETPRV